MLLTLFERRLLLRFARDTIGAHLTRGSLPALTSSGGLDRRSGAFVTLRLAQKLRGCIGRLEADEYLVEVVRRCAIAAATEDPRFPPLLARDLPRVEVEISVLGLVLPISDPEAVEVGRHGLIAQRGDRRGLLLPQVAVEWGWDREMFLGQTCAKAGLPVDAWRKGVQLFTFEAEVFGESEAVTT